MLWKSNPKTVSLVVNPAPHPPESDSARRQRYCMDVLLESSPPWVTTHFLDLACDIPAGALWRSSLEILGEGPPLPAVREMMRYAIRTDTDWAGVAVSDLIFTAAAWPPFQETEANIIIARASQVPDLDEDQRIVATPIRKWNVLSMDALFIRGPAKEVFHDDFPNVFLAEYWDDACQAWARRHRRLGIQVLNDHETMHRVHDPSWARGVTFPMPGSPKCLRAVGSYNRSMILEFKNRRNRK